MTDAVGTKQVFEKLAEQALEKGAESNKPEMPEGEDVSRFQNAMETNRPGEPSAPETVSSSDDIRIENNAGPRNLGDAILDGMEKMKDAHQEKIDQINKTLEKENDETLSFQDAMKLQFDLMQLNLQQDLTTKSADKTSQGVQTLFKNQ